MNDVGQNRGRSWWHGSVALVALVVLYFAVPLDSDPHPARLVLGLAGSLAAIVAVSVIVYRQALMHVRGHDTGVTAVRLLLLLEIVVICFALVYYLLGSSDRGQIAGISTRIDALYFTLSTLSTVGYGDIHATGQFARAMVSIQIVFNVVFVAVFVRLLTARLGRHTDADPPSDHEES